MTTRALQSGPTLFALLLSILGVVVAAWSCHFGLTDEGRIGPGAFPGGLGVTLAVLGAWLVAQQVRSAKTEGDLPAAADGAPDEEHGSGRKAFLILGMLAGAVALAPFVGLIPALTVLIFLIAFALERVGIVGSLTLSASCFALYYGVFELLLEVPMPGPL